MIAPMSGRSVLKGGWGVVAACGLGIMLTALDATAINVALADIQRDLGTNVSALQLMVNAFTLALVVVVVTMGRLADQRGRRRVYLWGFVGYALASVVCAVAPSEVVLIAGRLLLGFAGAILFSVSLALLRAGFPGDRLQWAIGIYATIAAVGLALGPLVGGALIDLFSWRAIFWANLPLAAVGIALTLAHLEESRDPGAGDKVDVPGVLLLGVGLGAVVLAVVQSSEWGWGSTSTIGLLAAGCVVLVAFGLVERRVEEPVVDFAMFRSPTFTGSGIGCLVVFWVVFAFLFVFGLYFQTVEDNSAFVAGLRLLPYAAAFVLVAHWVPGVVARFGTRATAVGSMALIVVGALGLSEVGEGTPGWLLILLTAAIGVANAGAIISMSAAGISAAPAEKAGLAAGILVMMRYLGAVIGVAIVGEVLDDAPTFVDGLSAGMKVTAAVGVVGAVTAALLLPARPPAAAGQDPRRFPHLHRAHSPHG